MSELVAIHGPASAEVSRTAQDLGLHPLGAHPSHGAVFTSTTSPVLVQRSDSTTAWAALGSDAVRAATTASSQSGFASGGGDLIEVALRPDHLSVRTGAGAHRWFRWTDGVTTVCCSRLSTLTSLLGTRTHVDRSYETFFLGFGFHPDGRTMFDNVDILQPGTFTLSGAATTDRRSMPKPAAVDHDAAVESLPPGAAMLESVRLALRERSDSMSEVAVLLGGFDSALVCSILRDEGKKVKAFTYDFPDKSMNQTHVDTVVDFLGIDHEWIPITADLMGEAFATITDRLNAPGAQPHYQLHTSLASDVIAAQGYQVVFNGDGADSALLGYPTVSQRSDVVQRFSKLPQPILRALSRLLSVQLVEGQLGQVARVGRSVLDAQELAYPARGHLGTRYLDDVTLGRLRSGPAPTESEGVEAVRTRLAEGLGDLDPVRLAFHGNGLPGASRWKVDGAVSHAELAHFTPFANPTLKRIAAEIPTEELRPAAGKSSSLGKQIFSDEVLAQKALPPEVVLQPKQSPATSPIDAWMAGPLKEQILDTLDHLPFEWNRAAVEGLLDPGLVESQYRRRVTLSKHTMQSVGLLTSYASFASLAP